MEKSIAFQHVSLVVSLFTMGSIGQIRPLPKLTALEQIGPRGYARYIFPFELEEEFNIDEVFRVIRQGYNFLKHQIPEVGCEVVPDLDSWQKNVMKLRMPNDGEFDIVTSKDLRDPGTFPYTYAELKSKGFPPSAFDGDLLCRGETWPLPGSRIPISLVQCNFIPGGLLVAWNVFHMVGDGTCYFVWAKVWAEGCRRAQGLQINEPIQLPNALWDDREQAINPGPNHEGKLEDHPEFILLPFSPTEVPAKMLTKTHRAQIFYISPESLRKLKKEANPTNATEPSGQKWISTNDAICALIWRAVIAAQFPLETLEGDPSTSFGLSVDGRLRTNPKIHPDTLGCFLRGCVASVSIRKMLSQLNIADLSILIRKAVAGTEGQSVGDVAALVNSLEDPTRLVHSILADLPGKSLLHSSWVNFDLYSLEWGSLLGDKIGAVRMPRVGMLHGGQIVLPVLPNGGVEIAAGIEGEFLGRLLEDPILRKFAVPV